MNSSIKNEVEENALCPVELFSPDSVIGIDPGRNTGIAVLNVKPSIIVSAATMDWWDAYSLIQLHNKCKCLVVIEDSTSLSRIWSGNTTKARALGSIGRSIGQNNSDSRRMREGLQRLGYYVLPVKPNKTKLTAKTVRAITGYKERTNEHNRDAIMMCWNHRLAQVVMAHVERIYAGQSR